MKQFVTSSRDDIAQVVTWLKSMDSLVGVSVPSVPKDH